MDNRQLRVFNTNDINSSLIKLRLFIKGFFTLLQNLNEVKLRIFHIFFWTARNSPLNQLLQTNPPIQPIKMIYEALPLSHSLSNSNCHYPSIKPLKGSKLIEGFVLEKQVTFMLDLKNLPCQIQIIYTAAFTNIQIRLDQKQKYQ